jgi:hypothetical protein
VLPKGSADLGPRFAVAAASVDVDGSRLAQSGTLALYRVARPLRLRSTVEGVQPDGWSGPTAAYNRYSSVPRGARVDVELSRLGISGPPPARVRLVVGALRSHGPKLTVGGPLTAKTVVVPNGATKHVLLPAPAAPFRVQVAVAPTFSPSQFGSTDARTLGVRVAFAVRR